MGTTQWPLANSDALLREKLPQPTVRFLNNDQQIHFSIGVHSPSANYADIKEWLLGAETFTLK